MQGGKLVPEAKRILDAGYAIIAPDVFMTGELQVTPTPPVNAGYAGFTFGYNRPLLANRVHDILTTIACVRKEGAKKIHLVGVGSAGPWVVLARAQCGDAVTRTAADLDQFRFEKVKTTSDEMMLPGALKYGGLSAFAALATPGELFLHNVPVLQDKEPDWLSAAYYGAPKAIQQQQQKASPDKVIDWLLR
jgi:hypothetical protein